MSAEQDGQAKPLAVVLEDRQNFQEQIQKTLELLGYSVQIFSSIQAVLESGLSAAAALTLDGVVTDGEVAPRVSEILTLLTPAIIWVISDRHTTEVATAVRNHTPDARIIETEKTEYNRQAQLYRAHLREINTSGIIVEGYFGSIKALIENLLAGDYSKNLNEFIEIAEQCIPLHYEEQIKKSLEKSLMDIFFIISRSNPQKVTNYNELVDKTAQKLAELVEAIRQGKTSEEQKTIADEILQLCSDVRVLHHAPLATE